MLHGSLAACVSSFSSKHIKFTSIHMNHKKFEPRRYVQYHEAFLKREKELMKNVPGYKPGENLYSGGRWMPPAPRVGAWGGA